MTRFMRWVAERRGHEFHDYDDLWRWSVQEVEDFWASIWEFCEVRSSKPFERPLVDRSMPGARWFAGAELNYAENLLAPLRFDGAGEHAGDGPRPSRADDVAVVHGSELRELDELTWARADGAGRRRGRGVALAGRRARRSRGRLHAEHPRDARGLSGDGVDRRDLVERRAGVRRAQRDRPFRADRAEGAAERRRLPPRRQGLRPHDRGAGHSRRAAERRAHGVARIPRRRRRAGRHDRVERAAGQGRGRGAELRAGALRPPAVGAVLLRHDRPAQGDRAGSRRHSHRAAEEAHAPGPASGRPHVLVHDDRLDDVELPRRLPAVRRRHRALRRQPGTPGSRRAVAPGRARAHHLHGRQRRPAGQLREGRRAAAPRLRPARAARDRLDRLTARAGELQVGLRARRRGGLAVLDQRRHRRVHGVRRRLPAAAGL